MTEANEPRSTVAVAFYAIGAMWLVANIWSAYQMGILGAKSGGSIATNPLMMVGLNLLIQPILVMLFGGAVQILSDIRHRLGNFRRGDNA